MRAISGLVMGVFIAGLALAQGGEPSLEDLEQMGGELNSVPVTEPIDSGSPAVDPGIPAAPLPAVTPASNAPVGEEIDLRTHVKKVSEPNLFAGAAPVPGTLRALAMGEAPEEYEVQEGDNLYDICDQLLDEPDYWPKLWSLNPSIANPHFVYPGLKLKFYAGDTENPPFLRVVTEDEILPVNKGGLVESELVREDISGMLMRSELPESMQVINANELGPVPGIEDMFIVSGNLGAPVSETKVLIPAFIVKEEFTVLGTVIGGASGSYLLDDGNTAIVDEEDDNSLKLGSSYTIVREVEKIQNELRNEFVGYRYEYIAQIKITEHSDKLSKGRINLNRLGVQPGDQIVAYRSVKRSVPMAPMTFSKGAGQEVVAFTEPYMELGGRGGIVFIDQAGGKLQEGASYRLAQNVKNSASEFIRDDLPDTDQRVGDVYIIDTTGAAAVGFITHDVFELRLGDRVQP